MKWIRIYILIIISLNGVLFRDANGQQTTWQRIFGGPRNDYAYQFFETIDGNYLMLGEKSVVSLNTGNYIPQTYLAKFNFFGNKLWEKYFGDSLRPNYPVSALELPSGNILVTYVNSNIGNLMKIDMDANLIWDKHYPNPISGFYDLSFIDNKKNILINGDQLGGLAYIENITKLDTNGNLFWTKGINDSSGHFAFFNSDIGYYSVGWNANGTKGLIDKRDTSGNFIWKRIIDNPYGNHLLDLYSVVSNSSTTFIAVGKICSSVQCGLFAIKFDSSGNIIWQKDFLSEMKYGRKIVKTLDNNFAIAGDYNIGSNQLNLMDSLGNIYYTVNPIYNPLNATFYRCIANSLDSGFLVSGSFETIAKDYSDFLLIKTDKNFNFDPVGVIGNNVILGEQGFELDVFPNPFNPTVNLKINLRIPQLINIKLFDLNGREIKYLKNQYLKSGISIFPLNTTNLNLSSGIYFVSVSSNNFSRTQKIILLK